MWRSIILFPSPTPKSQTCRASAGRGSSFDSDNAIDIKEETAVKTMKNEEEHEKSEQTLKEKVRDMMSTV